MAAICQSCVSDTMHMMVSFLTEPVKGSQDIFSTGSDLFREILYLMVNAVNSPLKNNRAGAIMH